MSRRDRGADPDAAERLRSVRERLEATVSGLGELDFLRQRQEVLVRTALELREAGVGRRREVELSSEEKLLQENILLLRKQLNCLRRRDAGLISQLQELDQQICDLRLDTDESEEQRETDSRPSSGFYELSDAASGSLSNSSNSVFSECFCSAPDADGRLPSSGADELVGCLECNSLLGGLCDDASSRATVRRSLSAPYPPTLDSCDSQTKCHYDLFARNGSDVYRYPSPLHAVAAQSPAFLQMLAHGHSRDEGFVKSIEAVAEAASPLPAPLVSQSSSWPASSLSCSLAPSHKHLDSYIYSLLQRRAQPVRTSKPRTSISTDPSKSILRQASLCVRQVSGPSSGCGLGPLTGSEPKPLWMEEAATSLESKCEEQQMPNVSPHGSGDIQTGAKMNNSDLTKKQNTFPLCNGIHKEGSVTTSDGLTGTNSLLKKKPKGQAVAVSTATLPGDVRQLGSPRTNSTPNETRQPCFPADQELLINCPTVKDSPELPHVSHTESSERSAVERVSLGSSSQSPVEGRGSSRIRTQNTKPRKSGSKPGNVKTSSELVSARKGDKSHHRSCSRKSRLLENGGSSHSKVSKRVAGGAPGVSSTQVRHLPASIPEGRVLDKQTASTLNSTRSGASRHHHGNHHHGRDQVVVVAKPKHKRNDYRRLRAVMEVPRLRQRKDPLSCSAAKTYHPSGGQVSSPYSYVGASDSEYSAECASLFHSTIVDTSEDEKSSYSTNCFGDSESSVDEYIEQSTTTSDTEESGGGGKGGRSRGWNQLGPTGARATGQEMSPAQDKAFVKIKASHNLKKKILRFRSGSLKLMTTV